MALKRLFKNLRRRNQVEILAKLHRPDPRFEQKVMRNWKSSFAIFATIDLGASTDEWMRMIESIRSQQYRRWRCFLIVPPSLEGVVRAYVKRDSRIRIFDSHAVSANHGAGEWTISLDAGYELAPSALFWFADAIDRLPQAAVIYADEDRVDELGQRTAPWHKTDWDPLLFLGCPYLDGVTAFRTSAVLELKLSPPFCDDAVFRLIEASSAQAIVHLPRILSHHQRPRMGFHRTNWEPVERHLVRTNWNATCVDFEGNHDRKRIRFSLPDVLPRVSIVIPTRNAADLVRQCIESIFEKSTYPDYEIILVDNGSDSADALDYFRELATNSRIQVIRDDGGFNYSRLNNAAVAEANGDVLVLLNNDTEVISAGWLEELVSLAMQPWAGAIGARLWYPNGTLQHGGVVMGMHGIAGHLHVGLRKGEPGYAGRADLLQSLTAVTGACLAVRKALFQEVGGLEERLAVGCNDIDFCLKLRAKGYRNVWTPYADLIHHESISRGMDDTPEKHHRFYQEISFMRKRWPHEFSHDPAYNPNLSYDSHHFALSEYPGVSEGLSSRRGGQGDLPRLLIVSEKLRSRDMERQKLQAEPLHGQGLIDSFALADITGVVRFSKGVTDGFEMIVLQGDVGSAWVDREVIKPLAYLADWSEIPATDRASGPYTVSRPLAFSAQVVVTDHALKRQIDGLYDLKMEDDVVVIPRGVFYRPPLAPAGKIRGLVWIYDPVTPLSKSADEIVAAIEQFSVTHRLPVYGFGHFPDSIRNALSRGVWMKSRALRFLNQYRNLIGIGPLEISGDDLLDEAMVEKSDERMAEYGGRGIPAVYSAARVYVDSDLKTGRLVENTTSAWLKALEELFESGTAAEDTNALRIRELRNVDRICRELLWPALQKVRLKQSFPVSWIGR